MGNVRDAMKKREVEEEAARAAAPSGGPSDATTATVPSRPAEAKSARLLLSASASGTNGYSPVLVAHHDRGGALAEEFRSLRTHLLAACPSQRFCYVVTSAESGEGKTVTCLNLALVMAERQDHRTIVVDCDYRKKMIAGLLKAKPAPGMVDVLRGAVRVRDVIQPTIYPNLFVIAAGEARDDEVGELVTRPELDEAVAELRRDYDYVLFDTPPVNLVSETSMIGRAVGDSLVVVRMNKTHRESTEKAIRLLHAANVRVAGLVLTHRTYLIPGYLYRYS